jgi:hypothetical protein
VRTVALVTSSSELSTTPASERARTEVLRSHTLSVYDVWASAITEHVAAAVGESPSDRWPSMFGPCMAAFTSAARRMSEDPTLDISLGCGGALDLLSGMDRPITTTSPRGDTR